MPLGILEDQKLEHVPGTAPLKTVNSPPNSEEGFLNTSALRQDRSGKFILVPQPLDGPNDPLN